MITKEKKDFIIPIIFGVVLDKMAVFDIRCYNDRSHNRVIDSPLTPIFLNISIWVHPSYI